MKDGSLYVKIGKSRTINNTRKVGIYGEQRMNEINKQGKIIEIEKPRVFISRRN